MRSLARTATALVFLLAAASAGAQTLPSPQTASAAGKPATDFTLMDQQGKPFHLAAMRGKRILLVFYRGYW